MERKYEKDFDGWNKQKQKIDEADSAKFCHPREVWWCALGINVGFEQNGTGVNYDRPVLVIKGFNERIFLGVALTGRYKQGRYYFPLGKIEGREATAILSQIKIIDTKRLVRKMAVIGEEKFENLKNTLQKVLFS